MIQGAGPTAMTLKDGFTFDRKSFRRVGEWHTHDGEGAPSAGDLYNMGKGVDSDGGFITFKPQEGFFQLISAPKTIYGLVVVDSELYSEFQSNYSLEDVEGVYQNFWNEAEGLLPNAGKSAHTEYALKKTMEHFNPGVELYQIYDEETSGEDANWTRLK